MKQASCPSNTGAVLIIVLGVLALLALLATAFASLQGTERRVARNYLDLVRAKQIAQSGVEDAVARLKEAFPARSFARGPAAWKYWGDDLSETKERLVVPIEDALNPSFAVEDESIQDPTDANVRPKLVWIGGKQAGFSGAADSGAYGVFGDHYVLKVRDLSGALFVNDGLEGGPQGSVSQNLKRILNVLGDVLSVPKLGDQILAKRPEKGYQSMDDLLRSIDAPPDALSKIRGCLTVHAWTDPNVTNPVPLSATTELRNSLSPERGGRGFRYERGNPPIYRLGKSKDASGRVLPVDLDTSPTVPPTLDAAGMAPACVYGLDTLNPQWIEIVPRAPVNVNSAPREVLVALLSGLKGFFLTDRRRSNPNFKRCNYRAIVGRIDPFSPQQTGGEYGFLVETEAIAGPGTTSSGGVSAFAIADEIIACREGKQGPSGFDYRKAAWGGPFKTWRQFNAFADNLARPRAEGGAGVIKDNRPLYFDYDDATADQFGNAPLVPSEVQKRHAEQAVADVLKANFNPNLHLNELNPDENLYTIVDKTDLIVASTEFTFLPTGRFEIESLGRILRPQSGYRDVRLSPDNDLVAQAKIIATVRLYDLHRETHQKHFQAGDCARRSGALETNNNRSVELGPEPDNGKAPSENEWDGYVALPTVGGIYHDRAQPEKDPHGRELWRTQVNTSDKAQFNAAFHVHFSPDFDAHHHMIDRSEIASRSQPHLDNETVMNFPDPLPDGTDAATSGPYGPASGPAPDDPGRAHWLAKSFRQSPAQPAPELRPFAPSDLRIDGGYSERHSAPAYYSHKGPKSIWPGDQKNWSGAVSFWFKPSFSPERTGKYRMLWDHAQYHSSCTKGLYVWPFTMWFLPAHFDPTVSEASAGPRYFAETLVGQFPSCSLAWGMAISDRYAESDLGRISRSLNHLGHPDERATPSPLRAHRWIHVTFTWYHDSRWDQTERATLYINGSPWYAPHSFTRMFGGNGSWVYRNAGKPSHFQNHDKAGPVHLRLGGPSVIDAILGPAYHGNQSADCTIDEFYVWKDRDDLGTGEPHKLWLRGRYYVPRNEDEGVFTSGAFALGRQGRAPAPPANAGSGAGNPPPRNVRILGAAWTWYGEPVDPIATPDWDGQPVLYDHHAGAPPTLKPKDVKPEVAVAIQDANVTPTFHTNDGFSPILGGDLQNPDAIRYQVRFRLREADALNCILLATPVLDDVTLYWDDGQRTYLSYAYDNRSF